MPEPLQLPFTTSHAFLIGINEYEHISSLGTAVKDATDIAELLKDENKHGYQTHLLTDASKKEMEAFFQKMTELVEAEDRVMFYYAGHGIAIDSEGDPEGYLVPADAEPDNTDSLVPMKLLHETLSNLPCKHGLLVLDCCFAGAFKWSTGYRAINWTSTEVLYAERFWRFVEFPAWQVITSSAKDQKAADILNKQALGLREEEDSKDKNSPFAWAFKQAIDTNSKADSAGFGGSDGVVTATELYNYIREIVETATLTDYKRQSPAIFTLGRHNTKGEYIFLNPGHRLNLPQAPDINPYKGLSPYEGTEADAKNFFGRTSVIQELIKKLRQSSILVISAPSGQGKSSVIKAGLFPAILTDDHPSPISLRPGERLREDWEKLALIDPQKKHIVLIDQYEEMFGLEDDERSFFEKILADFLCKISQADTSATTCLLAIRADFEWQLQSSLVGKSFWIEKNLRTFFYRLPPMNPDELREIMVKPAWTVAYEFESEELINQMLEEINHSPGALPLLSFTLQKLYEKRDSNKRLFTKQAYVEELGGVNGALSKHADALYEKMPSSAHKDFMRKLIIRMVRLNDGGYSRRRVYLQVPSKIAKRGYIDELDYPDHLDAIKDEVLEILEKSLLVIRDQDALGLYVEPMHDSLLNFWPRCLQWIQDFGRQNLVLQRQLWQAVVEHHQWTPPAFAQTEGNTLEAPLWANNPKLQTVQIVVTDPRDEWLLKNLHPDRSIASVSYLLWEREPEPGQMATLAEWNWFFEEENPEKRYEKIQNQMDHWLNEEELVFVKRSFEVQRSEVERLIKERDDARATVLAAKSRELYPEDNTLALNLAYAAYHTSTNDETSSAFSFILKNPESRFYRFKLTGIRPHFSSDGKYLLVNHSPEQINLHSMDSGKLIQEFAAYSGNFSPSGKEILLKKHDGNLVLLSVNSGEELLQLSGGSGFFHPDGKQVIIAYSESIVFYAIPSGKKLLKLPISVSYELRPDVHVSADGKYALLNVELQDGPRDKYGDIKKYKSHLQLYSLESGKELETYTGYSGVFSPNAQQLLIKSEDNQVKLISLPSGKEVLQFEGNHCEFSTDGTQLLAGYGAKIYSLESKLDVKEFAGYSVGSKTEEYGYFSPDAKYVLLSTSESKGFDLLSVETGEKVDQFLGKQAIFSPDGNHILINSDYEIKIFPTTHEKEIQRLPADKILAYYRFSPNNKEILIKVEDSFRLYSIESGQELHSFKGDSPEFSPDGENLALFTEKGLTYYSLKSGKKIMNLRHRFGIYSISPDGKYLLISYRINSIRYDKLYSLETGKLLKKFEAAYGCSFSADSKWIVIKEVLNVLELYEINTLKKTYKFECHSYSYRSEIFSPDGKLILLPLVDNILCTYSLETGKELHKYVGDKGIFSSDSTKLYISHNDTSRKDSIEIYSTHSGDKLGELDGINVFSGMKFTPDKKFIIGEGASHRVYSTEMGKEIMSIPCADSVLTEEGHWLIAQEKENGISIWKQPFQFHLDSWDPNIYKLSQSERAEYKIQIKY